jgi:hypothetical protein
VPFKVYTERAERNCSGKKRITDDCIVHKIISRFLAHILFQSKNAAVTGRRERTHSMPDCVVGGIWGEICCISGRDVVATVVVVAGDVVIFIAAVGGMLVTAVRGSDADLLNCSEEKP